MSNYSCIIKSDLISSDLPSSISRQNTIGSNKNSQTKSLAIQGKHPVSDHSLFPLGNDKNIKSLATI